MLVNILITLGLFLGGILLLWLAGFLTLCLLCAFDRPLEYEDEHYWSQYDLSCPHCGETYPPGVRTRQMQALFCEEAEEDSIDFEEIEGEHTEDEELKRNPGLAEDQSSFACPKCGEAATFARLKGGPRFICFEQATRRCLDCTELFYGALDSPCLVCGEVHSELAVRSAIPPDQWRATAKGSPLL